MLRGKEIIYLCSPSPPPQKIKHPKHLPRKKKNKTPKKQTPKTSTKTKNNKKATKNPTKSNHPKHQNQDGKTPKKLLDFLFEQISRPWILMMDLMRLATKIRGFFCFFSRSFDPWSNNADLGGGFKYFLFSPLLGEMIQFDYIMFFRRVETTNQWWWCRNPARKPVEIGSWNPMFFFFLNIPGGAGFLNHQQYVNMNTMETKYQHVPFRNSLNRNDRMKWDISGRMKKLRKEVWIITEEIWGRVKTWKHHEPPKNFFGTGQGVQTWWIWGLLKKNWLFPCDNLGRKKKVVQGNLVEAWN